MRKNINSLVGCLMIVSASVVADAQVIYRDIDPDKVINFSDYEINVATSPDSCYLYPSRNIKVSLAAGGGWVYWQSDAEVLVDPLGRAMALSIGQPVDGTWATNGQAVLNSNVGNWISVTNKYLGVRVRLAGQWFTGWVRMDIGSSGTYGIVKDYAFNAQPNGPIAAGQVLTTAVNNLQNPLDEVSIYTVNRNLVVNGLRSASELSVNSLDGKIVYHAVVSGDANIALPALSAGIYIVDLRSKEGRKATRIFID
jgi:hypothetical protein